MNAFKKIKIVTLKALRKITCKHDYYFFRNIYGGEINKVSLKVVYRSWWKCRKCGRVEPRKALFSKK